MPKQVFARMASLMLLLCPFPAQHGLAAATKWTCLASRDRPHPTRPRIHLVGVCRHSGGTDARKDLRTPTTSTARETRGAEPATQDPKPAEQPDAEIQRILQILERADQDWQSGQNEQARLIVRTAMTACLALTGLDDRAAAQHAMNEIGHAAIRFQDLHTAQDAFARVLAYRERVLPADHPDLQAVRSNLGAVKHYLGDLQGARVLMEQSLAVSSRTLRDDDPDLQADRNNLAAVLWGLRDLQRAVPLQRKVLEVYLRKPPEDAILLAQSRVNLAASLFALNDLRGALALQEQALVEISGELPEDDLLLLRTQGNLALTKKALGDWQGALALEEHALTVCLRALPEDHPQLQIARANLAATLRELGDSGRALALAETDFEVSSRLLPDDHPDLQTTREFMSQLKQDLGDLQGSLQLQERVVEVFSTLPDDHPRLLLAQGNLANARLVNGDREGALALQERVVDGYARRLPDHHPQLQWARRSLMYTLAGLGRSDELRAVAADCVRGARASLTAWNMAPRELGALAGSHRAIVDALLSFASGYGRLPPIPGLATDALLVSQALRGIETRSARRVRRARAVDAGRFVTLQAELRAAIDRVTRAAGEPAEDAAQLRARNELLDSSVRDKERIERELARFVDTSGGFDPSTFEVADLARALPPSTAAVAIVAYRHRQPTDPDQRGLREQQRLVAFVFGADAEVELLPLGPAAAIETNVDELRTLADAAAARGLRGDNQSRPPRAEAPALLRRAVLDPILAAAGDVDTLYLSVTEALELVPLDALPMADGRPVGAQVAFRPLVSLVELLEPPPPVDEGPPALALVGGVDYGRCAADDEPAAKPNDLLPAAAPVVSRSGEAVSWQRLPKTLAEVEALAELFRATFGEAEQTTLTGDAATKGRLAASAERATYVHIATHGYFAPETVASTVDVMDAAAELGSHGQRVTGLSPLVLTGLTLSGANLPVDAVGRVPGILTAEEILALDLSHCQLVTLSACDTSLGVRRAGQGYASLRAALLGAGARYVLTSLWKVGDAPTKDLMIDFYRRLWKEGKEPHVALWEAKIAAREKGFAFRDWAGWVLTGR